MTLQTKLVEISNSKVALEVSEKLTLSAVANTKVVTHVTVNRDKLVAPLSCAPYFLSTAFKKRAVVQNRIRRLPSLRLNVR